MLYLFVRCDSVFILAEAVAEICIVVKLPAMALIGSWKVLADFWVFIFDKKKFVLLLDEVVTERNNNKAVVDIRLRPGPVLPPIESFWAYAFFTSPVLDCFVQRGIKPQIHTEPIVLPSRQRSTLPWLVDLARTKIW